jgi:hypothetical protein
MIAQPKVVCASTMASPEVASVIAGELHAIRRTRPGPEEPQRNAEKTGAGPGSRPDATWRRPDSPSSGRRSECYKCSLTMATGLRIQLHNACITPASKPEEPDCASALHLPRVGARFNRIAGRRSVVYMELRAPPPDAPGLWTWSRCMSMRARATICPSIWSSTARFPSSVRAIGAT